MLIACLDDYAQDIMQKELNQIIIQAVGCRKNQRGRQENIEEDLQIYHLTMSVDKKVQLEVCG